MKMSNLKTTDMFSIDLNQIKGTNGDLALGYTVKNLKTEVGEYETFSLAEALQYVEMTEPMITPLFDEAEADLVLHS